MPRIKAIETVQAQGLAAELFAGPLRGRQFNLYKSLAAAPAALNALVSSQSALDAASLTTAERAIVQLTIAQMMGSQYDIAMQSALARSAGLDDDQILMARRGSMTDPRFHALCRLTRSIHDKRGRIRDDELDPFRAAGFTDQSLGELVALASISAFQCTFNLVNQTPPDFVPGVEI